MTRIPRVSPGGTQLTTPKVSTESPQALQTQTIGGGKGLIAMGGAIEQSANVLYQKMERSRNYAENAKADVYKNEYMAQL